MDRPVSKPVPGSNTQRAERGLPWSGRAAGGHRRQKSTLWPQKGKSSVS